MFKRLLVPMDGSERDADTLAAARSLAQRTGASLILVHVEQPVVGLGDVVRSSQYLERMVAELRAQGFDARHFVEYGKPDSEIVEAAEQLQVDLIVMAPHHRSLLDSMRHPSITARTISRAPAPLLVWPPDTPGEEVANVLTCPGALVLVPLDGSEQAERALPFAVAFAREFARPLVLVRVVAPVTLIGAGPDTARLEMESQAEDLREARTYLGVMRKRLAKETGVDVQSMVLRGAADRELLRVSESHTGSVMVMSTHGRNGFARMLMGSVAAVLVRDSAIPVVVISPRASLPVEAVSLAREVDVVLGATP